MNVNRALTPKEKKILIIVMIAIIVIVGLTRPMWSKSAGNNTSAETAATQTTETASETADK